LLYRIYIRLGTIEKPAAEAEVAKVVATLVKACTDANAGARGGAAGGIGRCRDARRDLLAFDSMIDLIIPLLSDPDKDARLYAVNALSFYRSKAAPAIPSLIGVLDDREAELRRTAAMTLGNLDKAEKQSAARLRVMLRDDPDARCRELAEVALKGFGLSPDKESAGPKALPAR
jgi:HEAT repeat protein